MEKAQRCLELGMMREERGDPAGAKEEYTDGLQHLRSYFEVTGNGPVGKQQNLAEELIHRFKLLERAPTVRCPDYKLKAEKNEYGIPIGYVHVEDHDVHLTAGTTGIKWKGILKPVLEEGGFTKVVLNDGWGRMDSIRQMLELLIEESETLTTFTLKSKREWRREGNWRMDDLGKFEQQLQCLAVSARAFVNDHRPQGVTFQWEEDEDTHRRLMKFDDKWIFDLDHGLALFQQALGEGPHYTRIGHTAEGLRPTKAAHILVWKKAEAVASASATEKRQADSDGSRAGASSSSGVPRKRTRYGN